MVQNNLNYGSIYFMQFSFMQITLVKLHLFY